MREERYKRQTVLKEFGEESQRKLRRSSVLVVGAGGLGTAVMQYLNAMGIGTLGIIDNDTVSLSNLQRQVIYNEDDLGRPKVGAAGNFLKKQNSQTKINMYYAFLDTENALRIIEGYDLVVDATDNLSARYLVNDACVLLGKPFIYGALHGFEGHVSVFNYKKGPTYRCLYPQPPAASEIPNCAENGVLGVVPGIIGNIQALEAVKVICRIGKPLSGRLMIYNALFHDFYFMDFEFRSPAIGCLADTYELACLSNGVDAKAFMEKYNNEKIQVIDVRSAEEFTDFSLKLSINIPLKELKKKCHLINRKEKVYVLCQSGIRSQKAVSMLAEKFPDIDAVQVRGGLNSICL
ncbi:uba/thif-type nad/fad binding protein [Flavobacterium sp. F52]|nr:uba/thif-type nad/fad binding protein [Flavobacterium sp. F52]